jgi:alpha-methylacyl-CoA racemase
MSALAGFRVVEMDAIGPVPLACTILADMGADVVRITRPGGQAAYADVGGVILHRGRSAVELELKTEAGRRDALALVARADALVEGFRPGVMERLGLGPAPCLALNPRLVYARMTGWGQDGPMAERAGHDINYLALSGALSMIGEAGAPPPVPLNLVADYGGGAMFLTTGLLAAALSARRTGQGQVVDVAMTDGVAMLLSLYTALSHSGHWSAARASNLLDGGAPFYRCYACADGGHVAVGAIEPQFFAALLDGLGIPPAEVRQYDKATWPDLAARLAAAFAGRPRDHWAARFAATDACVSPVLSLAEARAAPQNAGRGAYQPAAGLLQPAPAPRFSGTPSASRPPRTETAADALGRWSVAAPAAGEAP